MASSISRMKQQGLSMVELLLAMTLGLIVVGAVTSIYVVTIRSTNDILANNRLQYDLEAAMALMANEIKRAGYSRQINASGDYSSQSNKFMGPTTDIKISDDDPSCILYTYDGVPDDPGDPPELVKSNEYYGFKLVVDGDDQILKIKLSGTTTDDDTCDDGSWEAFSNNTLTRGTKVKITKLEFSDSPVEGDEVLTGETRCLNYTTTDYYSVTDTPGCEADASSGDILIWNRVVNMLLEGELVDDDDVPHARGAIKAVVEIRNNKVVKKP